MATIRSRYLIGDTVLETSLRCRVPDTLYLVVGVCVVGSVGVCLYHVAIVCSDGFIYKAGGNPFFGRKWGKGCYRLNNYGDRNFCSILFYMLVNSLIHSMLYSLHSKINVSTLY